MRLPRGRLVIHLRLLMIIVLVLGLWMGWKVNRAHGQRRAVATVRHYNGHVRYDYEYVGGREIPNGRPWAPAWLRHALGDEFFQEVTVVAYVDQPITDATLLPLDDLQGIEELWILSRMGHHTLPEVEPPPGLDKLTEAGLAKLKGLTRLRLLDIQQNALSGSMLNDLNRARPLESIRLFDVGMTDDGMPPLKSMPYLSTLDLWSNKLTGTCLADLRGTSSLKILRLRWNPVSAAGLANIGSLTSLRELDLSNTEIDDAGRRAARRLVAAPAPRPR